MLESISLSARCAAVELCQKAGLKPGDVVVVGCSTSEISGRRVGTNSSAEIGAEVFDALNVEFSERGIHIAAQCCEHLNRALIVERGASSAYEIVNVVPTPEAGGPFAAAAYAGLGDPVAIDSIRADAGLDIGGTLIGMHLKRVAVILRLENAHIGKTTITAARTRPPQIGGARAKYDEKLV